MTVSHQAAQEKKAVALGLYRVAADRFATDPSAVNYQRLEAAAQELQVWHYEVAEHEDQIRQRVRDIVEARQRTAERRARAELATLAG